MYMSVAAVHCEIRKGAGYCGWFRVLGTEKFGGKSIRWCSLLFSSLLLQDTEDSLRTVGVGGLACTPPTCTFQSSMCRASPVNTSSHRLSGGGCFNWTGFGRASAHVRAGLPCLSSALLSTWRLRQRVGRYQRTGPEHRTSQERLKFNVVLVGVRQFI